MTTVEVLAFAATALFGFFAGILTTIAGMGGGLLLVLGLSLAWGPGPALAATAAALLVGNIHRVWLFQRHVNRRIVTAFAAGAVPGAFLGAVFVVALPERVIVIAMAALTILAVLRAANRLPWTPRASHLVPGGAFIGLMTGAAGGAGVLTGPLFMAAGLEGTAYVASTSAAAALMHTSRVIGYGTGGLFTKSIAGYAVALAVSIISGNLVGRRLRALTEKLPGRSIELATLLVCVALAIAGVAK